MYHPTTRVLAVLALLQAYGRMSGAELAQRLEVNVRTLRRYIIMLQDLGIPIEAERGRNGAYVLSAGFKLPPMMFTNEEALALTVGLISARHLNLADTDRAVESAFAKLERVMPLDLKSRVRARRSQQEHIIRIDHGRVGCVSMDFPDRSRVKGMESLRPRRHIMETAQPDKPVWIIQVIELPQDVDSDSFLRFDKLALEESDQFIAPARLQCVHPQLDDGGIG